MQIEIYGTIKQGKSKDGKLWIAGRPHACSEYREIAGLDRWLGTRLIRACRWLKQTWITLILKSKFGADGRIRTGDLLITNQLLYQLSYVGTDGTTLG